MAAPSQGPQAESRANTTKHMFQIKKTSTKQMDFAMGFATSIQFQPLLQAFHDWAQYSWEDKERKWFA